MTASAGIRFRGFRTRRVASSVRVCLAILALCAMLVGTGLSPAQASTVAPGKIVGWGSNLQGQTSPPPGEDFVAIDAGWYSLALRADGSLVAWGDNEDGVLNVPAGNDFIAIAAGSNYGLALHADGSIAAWGSWRKSNGPPDVVPPGTGYTAIAAEWDHLALRSDGTIAWGSFAVPPAGAGYTAIAVGFYSYLALRADGSIVGWRQDTTGIYPAPTDYGEANPPPGTGYTAIAAGRFHSLALRADGSVVGWGDNTYGQATPPSGHDFVAIDAGGNLSLALRADGSIAAWGENQPFHQSQPPPGKGYTAIAANTSGMFGLAIADVDPPETTITKGAPSRTHKSSVRLKFTSDDPGSTFQCKLDKNWKPCASPRKVKRLDIGKHTFQVRATDQAGNTDPTPAKDKFKVVD